ncbi:MAG: hypothetical protein KJ970_13475 [Candidatus Eisenbacteria bacterium]|uniref:Uncharacterized protein n=1 Tax=Eiseniibacteriota bacterium TaxID=2212470 RepID=A0A948RVR2_UNCEI|nr:hypothetical protein [Candidatus Eisenbacteria bacterium]
MNPQRFVGFPAEEWSNKNGLWSGRVGDGAKLPDGRLTLIDYPAEASPARSI